MRTKILETNIDFGMTCDDVLRYVDSYVSNNSSKPALLCTTNPFFVVSAIHDKEFQSIINRSILSVPDGVGVLYANLYLSYLENISHNFLFPLKAFFTGLYTGINGYFDRDKLGKTVTGVELTDKICELSAQKKYTVFFLGGRLRDKSGVGVINNYDMAMHAKEIMESKYPGLRVIGATSKFSRDPVDDAATISYIRDCMRKANVSKIDFLFVAYNPVAQEKWIARNADKIPATISIGIGRVFDYITNTMHPPSPIFDKLHIGWLYAFVYQPWRLKRILMTFPTFPIKVFLNSIK